MFACMHVCMFVCMYVCMHVCTYTYDHVFMYDACMYVKNYTCLAAAESTPVSKTTTAAVSNGKMKIKLIQ
jgi:hypothetical protein